jgi:hypothetical protein
MIDHDDPHPDLPSPRVRAACLVAFVLLMMAVPFLLYYFLHAPSPWKTEIGKVKLGNGISVHVGTMCDGDIGCDYYFKVRGKESKHAEWTYLAGSCIPAGEFESAVTADSRFVGIAVRKNGSPDCNAMMIYDSEKDERWAGSGGEFIRIWKELRKVNPRLPEAPYIWGVGK